jgi:hypothetical protein
MPRDQQGLSDETAATRQRLIEQLQELSRAALRVISISPPVRVAEAPPTVTIGRS